VGAITKATDVRANRLLAEERRRTILQLLEKHGRVTVEQLSEHLRVSAVTVRADLDALSRAGALVRSHGGAVRQLSAMEDYPLKFKETLHQAEKARIGLAAAQRIKPNQTILLDSGTTTVQVARHIKRLNVRPLTVITNALNIAVELSDCPSVSLIMIGGILRHLSNSFVGPQAESMLRDLHADHCFLAVDGLHPDDGLSTPDVLEAQLNSMMIRVSNEVTVVADASKFGRRSLSLIAKLDAVHRVITDNRITAEMQDAVKAKGVELVVV
jgi:Transcriptional regulators of sugar metabolism